MSHGDENANNALPLLDRKGPTYGITFTRLHADKLMQQHLNMTIKSFQYIDTGYNNLIFFIDTNESAEQYVLKVGGRYWIRIKTEVEVKALNLLTQYTTIPVPKVLAYSSDRSNEFGVEWILMTRLPGENMSKLCENQTFSVDALKSIIVDLAEIVSQMHSKVPRVNQIGTFQLNGDIGQDLNLRGPWSTFEDFMRTRVRAEIDVLHNNEVFAPIKDSILGAMDRFEQLQFPLFNNLPFVFSHGDLDIQNILISMDNPDRPHITGIVDWEWAGSFPCSEEYFTSFNYFLEHDNEEIQRFFLEQFEQRHILTPRTIERFSLLEKLNRFVTNLAPWDLTDLVNPDDPTVKKKLEHSQSVVLSMIDELTRGRECILSSSMERLRNVEKRDGLDVSIRLESEINK